MPGQPQQNPAQNPGTVEAKHAAHVLYVAGKHDHGPPQRDVALQPGSFIEALIEAMFLADHHELSKLYTQYPEYVYCIYIYKTQESGVAELVQRAEDWSRTLRP